MNEVAQAIEFAKQSWSDCSNLVAFVALKESGMLEAYLQRNNPMKPSDLPLLKEILDVCPETREPQGLFNVAGGGTGLVVETRGETRAWRHTIATEEISLPASLEDYGWLGTNRLPGFESWEEEIAFAESQGYRLAPADYHIPHWSAEMKGKVPKLYVMRQQGKFDELRSAFDRPVRDIAYPLFFKNEPKTILNSTGAELIAAERLRQVTAEGWLPHHDDDHSAAELVEAATGYAQSAATQVRGGCGWDHEPEGWPWMPEWWKPSDDPIRNLVKAGALIAAEIDRLSRLKALG